MTEVDPIMSNLDMPSWRSSPLVRQLLLFAVYLFPISTATVPLVAFDTGWHLNSGRWIVEQGHVPWTDPFTTVGDDSVWIAYSWLFSVALYGIHSLAGLAGIWLARVVMACVLVAALHGFVGRRMPNFAARMFVVGLAGYALTRPMLSERPVLFSILFTIATLEAVCRIRERRPLGVFAALPVVYALWANIHIQWIHGLFLIGLSAASMIAERIWRKEGEAFGRTVLLFAGCAIATLVNPYGWRLYDVILSYGSNAEIYELFGELHSMEFRLSYDWAVLAIFGLACAALGRGNHSLFDLVALAACAYFSFHAKHELWLVVLAAAMVLARLPMGTDREPNVTGREFACTLGGYAALLAISMSIWPPAARIEAFHREEFPMMAIEFIERENLRGPICAATEWGAYVAWKLPDRRVTIDGRAALHGGPRTRRIHELMQGRPGWERDADLRSAQTILVSRYAPLAELLRLHPDFRLRHEDDRFVVFTPRVKD